MRNVSFGQTALRALGCSTLLIAGLAGCSMGPMEMSGTASSAGVAIKGNVHGGEQPVTGSSVKLWAVGNTGYGSAATSLLTLPVTTDALGNFSITADYVCPTASTLVYLTASGGNPGLAAGTNNTAIRLVAALGQCGQLSATSYVFIDEVTTVAAAFALGQYFTPTFGSTSTDSFGAPNTTQAQIGITNAFATVNNLVSTSTGTAITNGTISSGLGQITTTVESAKIYTIADILSACINSDGGASSPCTTTLFPDVVPTGGVTPTDTLQAAVDMSLNPTSNNANGSATNLTALYGLQSATPPFPGLSTAPTDWTIGINYSAGTNAANTLMNSVNDIAADSAGNIWVINLAGTTTAQSLAEFSPTGTPLANPLSGGGTAPASLAATSPRNLAIDTNNNVWVATSSGSSYTFEWQPATSTAVSNNTGGQGYGIAIDGNNNVWIGQNSSSAGGSLSEYLADTLAPSAQVKYPFLTGTTNTLLTTYAAVSTNGSVWLSSGGTTTWRMWRQE